MRLSVAPRHGSKGRSVAVLAIVSLKHEERREIGGLDEGDADVAPEIDDELRVEPTREVEPLAHQSRRRQHVV
jgi:hypothetical protein